MCYIIVFLSLQTISQPFAYPLLPPPKPAPIRAVAQTPSHPLPLSVPSNSSVKATLDFSSPAQFTPCLDTSAARHRMSIKPRNQRASTKRRLPAVREHFVPPDILFVRTNTQNFNFFFPPFFHRLTLSLIYTPKITSTTLRR